MRSIQDAFFNWLSIREVAIARPDDVAAKDTEQLFFSILQEQYGIGHVQVEKEDEFVFVSYEQSGEKKQMKLPKDYVESMIDQMNRDPEKYK